MKSLKKILVGFFILLLLSQSANAVTASGVADKTIDYAAKTTYYVTKYTLKSGWFVIKKTAKGVKVITVSIFNATHDAFSKNNKPAAKPAIKKPSCENNYNYNDTVLPPPPEL